MQKLKRYEAQVRELEGRRQKLLNLGKYMQAMALSPDIDKARKMLDDYRESIRPRLLRELLTPEQIKESGIEHLIAEIHLATDFLIVCQYNLMEMCKNYGILIEDIRRPLQDSIKRSNEFVSQLMGCNKWLEDMMTENETLNEAIHKKITSYINQRDKKYRAAKRKTERGSKKTTTKK